MKKMNWKLRFKNKTTLVAIVMAGIALVYQIFALIGIVLPISKNQVIEVAGMVINLFVLLGIVVDPTTKGIADSEEANKYDHPN